MEYLITSPEHADKAFPNANESCGRVSVILGSNGSGKSRLLDSIASTIHSRNQQAQSYLRIESNRIVTNELNSASLANNYASAGTPERAESTYKSNRSGMLSSRIRHSLTYLIQRTNRQRAEHLDRLEKWDTEGRIGTSPKKEERAFQTFIRLFQSIFPTITIRLTDNEQLYLTQHGVEYSVVSASEGERQVVALIADLILNNEPNFTIIVDEPEAHLNPLLANQFWDVIEDYLPEAQFIYATHSISFGMREHVDSLFVINKAENKLQSLGHIKELPESGLSTRVRTFAPRNDGIKSYKEQRMIPQIYLRNCKD